MHPPPHIVSKACIKTCTAPALFKVFPGELCGAM